MPSAWITHVKNYAKEHDCSYKEALSKASASYKKQKGEGCFCKKGKQGKNQNRIYPEENPAVNYIVPTLTESNTNPIRQENNRRPPNRVERLPRGIDIRPAVMEENSADVRREDQTPSARNISNQNQQSSNRNSLENSISRGSGKKKLKNRKKK